MVKLICPYYKGADAVFNIGHAQIVVSRDLNMCSLLFQKCNKLSCQVEVGNVAFSWSDASPSTWTNWAPEQPSPM